MSGDLTSTPTPLSPNYTLANPFTTSDFVIVHDHCLDKHVGIYGSWRYILLYNHFLFDVCGFGVK